jgi:peptidoglycan/xylan/chitin deacetylase (PgdA/CDA1 family)
VTGMSSEPTASPTPALISGADVDVRPLHLASPTTLLSIDVETDYGTGRTEALAQIGRFLDAIDRLQIPATAFVEGQLFERHPAVCEQLVARGVDVQLHVYDHSTSGDTPQSLERGAAAYEKFMGRRPKGYRAHTYRLTTALYDALMALGFDWDSSVMRAYGLGRNADAAFAPGDYFLMGELVEFPLGAWRFARLPLNHPYSLLAGSAGGALLRGLCGPAGSLVAFNVHMTDLVRSPALAEAPYGRLFDLAQRWMWLGHGPDSFAAFAATCTYLRERGFLFLTTSDLYSRVAHT